MENNEEILHQPNSGNDISSKTAGAAWIAAKFALMEGQPHTDAVGIDQGKW